jgi:hypothetical protein
VRETEGERESGCSPVLGEGKELVEGRARGNKPSSGTESERRQTDEHDMDMDPDLSSE